MNDQLPAAGWYPQGNEERYWDGQQWTDQRRPLQAPAPQAQAPQPQYAMPPQKQKHTVRNVLLVVIGLGVLFVGGCLAIVAVTANEVGTAIDEGVEQDSQPGGPDNPMKIVEGQAFEVDGFKYAAGWSVEQSFGMIDIRNLKVTNKRNKKDSALVEIKFWRGSEVLALADCTTEPIAQGTTTTLTCGSGDKLPKSYSRMTINDTF